MIGLYTGARISEVAQMKVADVVEQKGVLCFAIRKTIDADLPKMRACAAAKPSKESPPKVSFQWPNR